MSTKTLTLSKNMIMDTMVLEVPLPKELVSILGFAQAQRVQTIQEFLAIGLYQEGRISSGKAAELLGMTKREFIRLLARKGIPYFDYSPEELAEEFETVEAWRKENLIRAEDSFNLRKWGEEYRQYMKEVPAINFVKGLKKLKEETS